MVISVFRSSSRSHATHAIGELKNGKSFLPGKSAADEPNKTQSPVSKFADLQVEFLRHNSMQSVNMSVPGLESNISSGAV